MAEVFRSPTLDDAFIRAVQNAADLEYEYVLRMVGEDGLLQDIAHRDLARQAVRMLQSSGAHILEDYEFDSPIADTTSFADNSSLAAREHLGLITEEIGSIGGFHLIHIDARRFIVDQVVRIGSIHTETISLEASYYPDGTLVTKDRYGGLTRSGLELEALPVTADDFAVIAQFIRRIETLR